MHTVHKKGALTSDYTSLFSMLWTKTEFCPDGSWPSGPCLQRDSGATGEQQHAQLTPAAWRQSKRRSSVPATSRKKQRMRSSGRCGSTRRTPATSSCEDTKKHTRKTKANKQKRRHDGRCGRGTGGAVAAATAATRQRRGQCTSAYTDVDERSKCFFRWRLRLSQKEKVPSPPSVANMSGSFGCHAM
jgi:hypothetical protein